MALRGLWPSLGARHGEAGWALPLPQGLSDFLIVLAVVSLLVLLYKLNRVWLRVALILLWGVAIASVIYTTWVVSVCRMLKILDSPTMKHFTLRDCGDTLVVEIDNIVIVLDKRLEKTHSALKRLEIGLTLDTPLEAIEEFERLLRRRLEKLVVLSEEPEEVGSSGRCPGYC